MEPTSFCRPRTTMTVITGLLLGIAISGCAAADQASATTCDEFARMSPDTGLMSGFNNEQQQVLSDLLEENGAAVGQEGMAGAQVIAFCNIYGGVANGNADRPISEIPGLQD